LILLGARKGHGPGASFVPQASRTTRLVTMIASHAQQGVQVLQRTISAAG
jgi:hypothetical protein